jgi:hypothetical protein
MRTATGECKEEERFRVLKAIYDQQEWDRLQEDRVLRLIWRLNDPAECSEELDDELDDADVDVSRPLLEGLGLDVDWAPEELAPEVDDRRIEAFHRGELSGEQLDTLIHLLARFRSWHTRSQEIHRRKCGLPERPSPEEAGEDWIAQFDDDAVESHSRRGLDVGAHRRVDGGPPVDEERLLALVRRELPLKESRELVHLVVTFEPWFRGLEHVVKNKLDKP